MDQLNVGALVNLDGRWGRELEENLERYDRAHPGRFYSFCHLDWRLLDQPGGEDRLVASLERSIAAGARGLKVWKDLGMSVRVHNRSIMLDDPRLAAVWARAGELGVPVLIHVADPIAFFHPADLHNERLEELLRSPKSSRSREGLEEFHRLHDSFENVVASHPSTRFVGAHGLWPENLAHVSAMLDHYPNLSIDIAARAAEFGRQPRAARLLLTRHQDRVLFGTDIYPIDRNAHQIYFRLLETNDEAFSYSTDPIPPCGRWPIYGLGLEEHVLVQIYRENARKLLGLLHFDDGGGDGQIQAQNNISSEPAHTFR
jgi:predicted TIM-barrel fold metal-dependent hydrolase